MVFVSQLTLGLNASCGKIVEIVVYLLVELLYMLRSYFSALLFLND